MLDHLLDTHALLLTRVGDSVHVRKEEGCIAAHSLLCLMDLHASVSSLGDMVSVCFWVRKRFTRTCLSFLDLPTHLLNTETLPLILHSYSLLRLLLPVLYLLLLFFLSPTCSLNHTGPRSLHPSLETRELCFLSPWNMYALAPLTSSF